MDSYEAAEAGGSAYGAGGAGRYDPEASYGTGGAGYDAGETSFETGGEASFETGAGVADNVEIKTESDEDDDFSNLIMVANDDDDEGFNDEDAEDDPDRDPLSEYEQDPLVIDEAPAQPAGPRPLKTGKMAKQNRQRKLGAKQKSASKMWKQQRMTRKDKGVSKRFGNVYVAAMVIILDS